MNTLTQSIQALALDEIKQYGLPPLDLFHISEKKAIQLAEKLNLDTDTVIICHACMDIKLGQCAQEWRMKDHVADGISFIQSIAADYHISDDLLDKIVDTIACHHGQVESSSLEAEVCRNADCYRFLDPKGILIYLHSLGGRWTEFMDAVKQVESKMDEKRSLLTLDICKQELEWWYRYMKDILQSLKE